MVSLEDVLGDELSITVLRFLSQIQGATSGNGIATRLGRRQSSIRKALERLVALGVVRRTDIGRTAGYEVDARDPLVRYCILDLFAAEHQLRDLVIENVRTHTEHLGRGVLAVILYGSVARGERSWRDIDVVVVTGSRPDAAAIDVHLANAAKHVRNAFAGVLNARVLRLSDLMSRGNAPFRNEIVRDGIQLHGKVLPKLPLRNRVDVPRRSS